MELACLDTLVPKDHILRKIDQAVDLSFIHGMTRNLYSENSGRKCIDTVILFKIVLLNFIYGNNSIRKTCEEAKVNLAYQWYLGIGLSDPVPNYSTFSQNYIRKFSTTNIFEEIFSKVLEQIMNKNLIDTDIIFVDGTHIKANANKHKSTKKKVKIITDKYHKELENEVNEFREINGRDRYPSDDDDNGDGNITNDEETGEIKEKENSCKLLVPYVRPKGKRTEFGKKAFEYYFEIDEYMCSNKKMLIPWNITKDGYIQYRIQKDECGNCPNKDKCIKKDTFKTVTRHLYEDCMLLAREYRLSEEGKEYHGLRYTRYKGLKKNSNIRALLYACLNIKKLALLEKKWEKILEKKNSSSLFSSIFQTIKKLWIRISTIFLF